MVLLAVAGCTTLEESWRDEAAPPAAKACVQHYAALDAAVERSGVRDAEARRVRGFPYLRVDRFNASLREAAATGTQARAQWLTQLQALDHAARRVEISNLPEVEVSALQDSGAREALLEKTARCADLLREQDEASPARMQTLHARAQVPDAYVTAYRVTGLYALTRMPFASGIAQWHREALQDFGRSSQPDESAVPRMRYALPHAPAASRSQIAALLRRAADNPLRVPRYSAAEAAALASAFAPLFEVETGGPYDRIGRMQWGTDVAPQIDTATAAVYYRIAYTRYGGATLTQIVYTAWFPERPHDHALDILAGRLDGVVMRVTLDGEGNPLLYDSIHPCGCYHLFFPTARLQPLPAPQGEGEWAFIPATLPAHGAGTRIAVRIATRSHYVVGIALDSAPGTQAYTLLPEDVLRTLPAAGVTGAARSAYGPDGLVPGTERGERFFFWPMGIPSAGAMRQWGHHASAFVGRRHFDDADLVEKRFRIVDGAAP